MVDPTSVTNKHSACIPTV